MMRVSNVGGLVKSPGLVCVVAAFWMMAGMGFAFDEAWFGVPTPEQGTAERESLKSIYADLGMGPLPLALPVEDDPYRGISGKKIHRYMSDICAISEESRLAGDPMWGRICGTPYERKAAQYVLDKFTEFGLEEVHLETFARNAQWWPTQWELALVGEESYGTGTKDYVFSSAFPAEPSPATPSEGLEAELVYVGMGRPVDLVGRDLRGKIAVVHSEVPHSTFRHSGRGIAPELIEAGAAGVITIVNTPGNLLNKIQGTGSARAPGFNIGGEDGAFLEEVIARAGGEHRLKIRMKLAVESKEGWETQNAFGMIRGETDEYVLITAHLDAYFYGASDNASGVATMISLAEHFSRDGAPRPKRNLVFIATGGHHARSVGVANLVREHGDMLKKTVLDLNCEHTSAILVRSSNGRSLITANTESPKSLGITNASPLVTRFMADALGRYGVVTNSKPTRRAPGDAGGFIRAGLPVVQLIESNYWYHASADRPETITSRGLERTARAYAQFLDSVDGASREDLERGAVN